jgi:hypothetical protein
MPLWADDDSRRSQWWRYAFKSWLLYYSVAVVREIQIDGFTIAGTSEVGVRVLAFGTLSLPAPGVANVRLPRGRFASGRRLGVARRSTSNLLECLLPFLDIIIHLRHHRNIITSFTVRMM